MSAGRVDDVELPGSDDDGRRQKSLQVMWHREKSTLGRSMRTTFEAISGFGPAQAAADNRSTYPGSSLGQSLATAAQIIRGDVGVEVITVDQGDWDMHTDMGNAGGGWMWNNAEDLAPGIAAFFADLGTQESKVTLVTLSEFGRRVVENDSNGTDHGYGNVMFVAGRRRARRLPRAAGRGWPPATTPTSRSPRTTARCSPTSSRGGSTPRWRRCSPG